MPQSTKRTSHQTLITITHIITRACAIRLAACQCLANKAIEPDRENVEGWLARPSELAEEAKETEFPQPTGPGETAK